MKRKALSLLLAALLLISLLASCAQPASEPGDTQPPETEDPAPAQPSQKDQDPETPPEEEDYDGKLVPDHSMELYYAKCFTVDYYRGGYKLASTSDGTQVLVVPEGMSVPADAPEGAIVLQQPVNNMLVASTPVVSLINAMGALDTISLTTTSADSWTIDQVKDAMDSGDLTFVGDSTAPDYEMITAAGCTLAVYTPMITEDVAAQLDALGLDVIRDLSSNEEHPLARVEWVKLYGALLNKEEEANRVFDAQAQLIDQISQTENTGKTVAVFYITSSGGLYARNAGDYMAKMVDLAGGRYALPELGVGESGTTKMEFEAFYDAAQDADFIIYIWSMGGKPETLADVLSRADILSEMKAVKEGNVWCTTPDFFQIQDSIGSMVNDIHLMLEADGSVDALTYLTRLK